LKACLGAWWSKKDHLGWVTPGRRAGPWDREIVYGTFTGLAICRLAQLTYRPQETALVRKWARRAQEASVRQGVGTKGAKQGRAAGTGIHLRTFPSFSDPQAMPVTARWVQPSLVLMHLPRGRQGCAGGLEHTIHLPLCKGRSLHLVLCARLEAAVPFSTWHM
jgi:hypothetical protein